MPTFHVSSIRLEGYLRAKQFRWRRRAPTSALSDGGFMSVLHPAVSVAAAQAAVRLGHAVALLRGLSMRAPPPQAPLPRPSLSRVSSRIVTAAARRSRRRCRRRRLSCASSRHCFLRRVRRLSTPSIAASVRAALLWRRRVLRRCVRFRALMRRAEDRGAKAGAQLRPCRAPS